MPRLIVQPRAEADIEEAVAWYHPRDPRLVSRFLAELDQIFDRITQTPGQFPIVAEPIQQALFRKFPYSVFFIVSGDLAAVVSVLHQSRRPVNWKSRSGAG